MCRAVRLPVKLSFFIFTLLLPSLVWGVNFRRLRLVTLEKLAVPVGSSLYPDTLILDEVGRSTVDMSSWTSQPRIMVKLAAASGAVRGAGWTVAIPGDSNLQVTTLWKRKVTSDTLSDLIGYAEVTPDKFGQQQTSQPVFCNFRVGDTLKVMVQPTPKIADTLWAEVSVYCKWCLGAGGLNAPDTTTECPLPYPYEGWVPILAALRLLSREDPYRTNVITALYDELRSSVALYRKDLVERLSDLYALPNYIRATEEGKAK